MRDPAAFVMLASLATVRKYCNARISILFLRFVRVLVYVDKYITLCNTFQV